MFLCLEVDKNVNKDELFSSILNSEHEQALAYFANYGIVAQYMAYLVIIFIASIKTPSYAKSRITLLLRHTPTDVLNYMGDSAVDVKLKQRIVHAKRDFMSYIVRYHPEAIKVNNPNPYEDVYEFLNNSISLDEYNKDTYFGSTFFNIENGAIFEYRGFKTEVKNDTVFPSILSVPSVDVKRKYDTNGMGIKNKISKYNMARRQHKHTNKCRNNRGKCPLRKTRRRRLRGG